MNRQSTSPIFCNDSTLYVRSRDPEFNNAPTLLEAQSIDLQENDFVKPTILSKFRQFYYVWIFHFGEFLQPYKAENH